MWRDHFRSPISDAVFTLLEGHIRSIGFPDSSAQRMLDPVMVEFLLHNNHGLLPPSSLSLQSFTTLTFARWLPVSNWPGNYGQLELLDPFRLFSRLPSIHTISLTA